MNLNLKQKVIWLTAFSIAMGFLETAVVVYLREIYYPHGFEFPLVPIISTIAITEVLRELATLIMLLGIGILTGKNKAERFVCFLYSFAVWDIFYYIFLKLLLQWPASLFTWDILFLLPVPWVGPVIAPCITSLSMIVLFAYVMYYSDKNPSIKITAVEWKYLILGSIIVIISFVWDYFKYKINVHETVQGSTSLLNELANYIPQSFNWPLFWFGQCIILFTIYKLQFRLKHESSLIA
ncbi:MAG TPA: hypothetical protein PK323_11455 [Bacteroidia bacterium]|nr:hypothetical protein [Bacteroidia bacterium]